MIIMAASPCFTKYQFISHEQKNELLLTKKDKTYCTE